MKLMLLAATALICASCMDNYKNSLCADGVKIAGLAGSYKGEFMGGEIEAVISEKENHYNIQVMEEDETRQEGSDFRVCEINAVYYFELFEEENNLLTVARVDSNVANGFVGIDFLNFDREVLRNNSIPYEILSSDWTSSLIVDNIKELDQLMLETATSEMSMQLARQSGN